jgi:hypothetical protein
MGSDIDVKALRMCRIRTYYSGRPLSEPRLHETMWRFPGGSIHDVCSAASSRTFAGFRVVRDFRDRQFSYEEKVAFRRICHSTRVAHAPVQCHHDGCIGRIFAAHRGGDTSRQRGSRASHARHLKNWVFKPVFRNTPL